MADTVTRSAARLATFIAVPIAVIVAVGVFALVSNARSAQDPQGEPSAVSSEPVAVELPSLDEDQTVACRALLAKLPDTARSEQRRPVTEGAEQAAAFGDPAVTLVCGVDAPEVAPTETVYPMDGVCWVQAPGDGAAVWTTVDRQVPVAVTVPGDGAGSGEWAQAFGKIVKQQLRPLKEGVPSGCG
ncbi:DUF3515 domain-containing protein [Phytomonospora sp. NPDC050363]|uniref:DUF3515 domain-containing protein n=1 Tax=Phytomonospora sp. NPDC050363 TaxID=3155642 RepID=UPI0033EDC46D